MIARIIAAACWLALAGASLALGETPATTNVRLPLSEWRLVERESGPVNYYTFFPQATPAYVHGQYRPPLKTAVFGYQLSEKDRHPKLLRWSWRAITLPKGGNECVKGKADSAASVYVTFRRALRWYTLKYVWSAVAPKGAVCASKRNPFVAQDSIILESGGPLNVWQSETIDLENEFRKHFADSDPKASVPDLLGLGFMTDGDQTESPSSADYADFSITH